MAEGKTMEWHIAKRSKACSVCGTAFEDGSSYKTIFHVDQIRPSAQHHTKKKKTEKLFQHEDGQRVEFCAPCWQKELEKERAYDFSWEGHIQKETPQGEVKVPLPNRTTILALFKEVIQTTLEVEDPEQKVEKEAVAYLLALMVERKKWLVQKETFLENEIHHAFYVEPKTEESFSLPIPFFSDDNLAFYKEKLAELFTERFDIDIQHL